MGKDGTELREFGMEQCVGEASVKFREPVEIMASASVVGTKEGQGPLGALFDQVGKDDYFGGKTWEEAESNLQKEALRMALAKADLEPKDVRFLFAGDLLGQSIASSFGVSEFGIPHFGLYGACSTCGEALSLGAMMIAGGFAERVACVTSSHFASAEREFRFPLEYGNQRPLSASWTVTGSGAFLLRRASCQEAGRAEKGTSCQELGRAENGTSWQEPGRAGIGEGQRAHESRENAEKNREWACEEKGRSMCARARILGMTAGRIVDYGLKDSMNMGACMAPAAADTLIRHFKDWGRSPADYDHVITGDLGSIGRTAFLDLLAMKGIDLAEKHLDCGMLIYDAERQDVHAGGSGCGCCAVTLSAWILKQLEEGFWKRVLFLPTGALLSKTSFNEGKTVPCICHAIVLENA